MGRDTLAPFALRSDKEWLVMGHTFIAYRVVRGVALISADPVEAPGAAGSALRSFLACARARGWRSAVMGSADPLLPAYPKLGLHRLSLNSSPFAGLLTTEASPIRGRNWSPAAGPATSWPPVTSHPQPTAPAGTRPARLPAYPHRS